MEKLKDEDALSIGKRLTHITCYNCKLNISVRPKARNMNHPEIFLCLDCVSSKVEKFPHSNQDPLNISPCLDFPVFCIEWSAAEELLMLEGMEKHGCGNFILIAQHIGNKKTPKDVEEHYWGDYLGQYGYLLPQTCISNGQTVDTSSLLSNACGDRMKVPNNHTSGEKVEYTRPVVRGSISTPQERISMMPGGDLPGYMPLRGDFDVEYDNEAELLIRDMDFSMNDHPSERQLKLAILKIYNTRLTERENHKHFAIQRQIVNFKRLQQHDKKLPDEERDLVGRLRPLARFHSASAHENLIGGILLARRLREEIGRMTNSTTYNRPPSRDDDDDGDKIAMTMDNGDDEVVASKEQEEMQSTEADSSEDGVDDDEDEDYDDDDDDD